MATLPVFLVLIRDLPGRVETLPLWPEFLKKDLLSDPAAALHAVSQELFRETVLAAKIYEDMAPLITTYHHGKHRNIRYVSLVIRHLRQEIIEYLRRLSEGDLSAENSKLLFAFTAIADDVDRMTKHMVNLIYLARIKAGRRIAFSDAAMDELADIEQLIGNNLVDAVRLMADWEKDQGRIAAIADLEDRIDLAVRETRDRHLIRFHDRVCPAEAGPVFLEMLIHLERISDHCQNVADYLGELNQR